MSEAVAWTRPGYQPMLTPPRPWASFDSGCYEDVRLSRSVKLVRTYSKEHRRLVREAIAQGQMTQVMDAVNAIQDTRWAIDGRTYRMIQRSEEHTSELQSLMRNSYAVFCLKTKKNTTLHITYSIDQD